MGFIDKKHAVVFFLKTYDARQIRDIAVHAEEAFGDNDRVFAVRAFFLKHSFQRVTVVVIVGETLGTRQTGPLQQGIVCKPVVKNAVFFAKEKTQGRDIGGMTADVDNAVFDIVKFGETLFQKSVWRTFPTHKTACAS